MNTYMEIIEGNGLMQLSTDQYYEIAQIIDNEFIGKGKTFTASKFKDYISLTTNKCDWASIIRIYPNKITRLGDDTNGFQPIHEETMQRIIQWYNQNK